MKKLLPMVCAAVTVVCGAMAGTVDCSLTVSDATIIDVFGCETGFAGTGKDRSERLRTPSPDSSSCEKRFFAYRRPVSDMLQSGNCTTPVETMR